MRRLIVAAVIFCWAGPLRAAAPPVGARMRNVVMHLGYGTTIRISDLRGRLVSRAAGPPVFDDVNSYLVDVDYGRVSMAPDSVSNLMNQYLFARDDAPLKKLTTRIEGGELVQSGSLKKGVSIPFTMHAAVSATPDGKLRLHPTKMKAAGFVSKRVLDFFGLELEKLVNVKDTVGVTIDGDDVLLDPERILPPPRIRGRLAKAWIENSLMVLEFGAPKPGIEPPVRAANYMYYRGGVLKFGKLTMEDTDLLIVDSDPRDPFDFVPAKYERQLVAGYSKNTPARGLIVHMPDADDLAAR